MSLLDELKQQKAEIAERLERAVNDVQYFDGRMADLLLAISALEPTPADVFAAEKAVAREQLEREPEIPADFTMWNANVVTRLGGNVSIEVIREDGDRNVGNAHGAVWEMARGVGPKIIAYRITEAAPADEQDDASEFAESVELVHDVSDLLTGPERMVQAAPDEAPALNSDMQDEREQPVTDVAALIASGEHSYDEVAAIAYPEPQWNEPEGYAPVTNPAADEAAKGFDHYDPKAVADRNRFNPFAMFRREPEEVS